MTNRKPQDAVPWWTRVNRILDRIGSELEGLIEAMFHTQVPVTWSTPVVRCDNLIWHHPAVAQYPCTCALPLGHEPVCVCGHQLQSEQPRRGAVTTATRRDRLSPQPPLTAPQEQYTTPLPPHARTVNQHE